MKQKNNPHIEYTIDFDVTPHQLRHTYITNLLYAGDGFFRSENCGIFILINDWGGAALYQINNFKEINSLQKIAITKHARERLEERGIKVDDVTHCIDTGERIKQFDY